MSIENFHIYLYKIIIKELYEAFPLPDCPLKKAKALWQREEAIKLLIHKLGGSNNGLNVTIELNNTESD
jgi:hypothetical protein